MRWRNAPDASFKTQHLSSYLFKVQRKQSDRNGGIFTVTKVSHDPSIISANRNDYIDSQGSNCTSKLSDSKILEDKSTASAAESDLMTPSEKESIIDVSSEWLDDKSLKRSLADQFSSTIPAKKTKAFIKQEKKD